ncbi:MAG: acetyltransferase (GNAT) family [halophilic archaeon J07HX64]|nr:MAG: acetyltransferase (GNAT) family [halophilic archaeon J07HX64]
MLTVLDGALLAVEFGSLRRAVEAGNVLVAVSTAGTVLGVLVLDGEEITAIAVRRRRRDQGIGTALVKAAAGRCERLYAEFDGRVAAFWRSLGFDTEPLAAPDRFRGRYPADTSEDNDP